MAVFVVHYSNQRHTLKHPGIQKKKSEVIVELWTVPDSTIIP